MSYKLQLFCVLFYTTISFAACGGEVKDKRQVGSVVLQKDDHQAAETGFVGGPAAAIHSGSKYFQYAHVPTKDHYEHGHKRGNEHHFIERHEKAHPHAGEFKTKVRWGDKHGGYGEHYWDFNHAGHDHDGEGEESQPQAEYAAYDDDAPAETQHRPKFAAKGAGERGKRLVEGAQSADVEFIDERARELHEGGGGGRHGGNYRSERDFERGKRSQRRVVDGKSLVFDQDGQIIVDKATGISYELRPVND